jgi:hypothetical protein
MAAWRMLTLALAATLGLGVLGVQTGHSLAAPAHRPITISGQAPPPPSPPPATGPCPAAAPPPPPPSALGASVAYQPGWNLVAVPAGSSLNGSQGSLYTLQAGDNRYEEFDAGTPLQAGVGYWAYFGQPTTVSLSQSALQSVSLNLPAGQWVLSGNSGSTATQVTGADCMMAFDPVNLAYAPTGGLTRVGEPGQSR